MSFASTFGLLGQMGGELSGHWSIRAPGYEFPPQGARPFDDANLMPVEEVSEWLRAIRHLDHWTSIWRVNAETVQTNSADQKELEALIDEQISLRGHVRPRIVGGQLAYVPESLHSAIWHQFALAVVSNKQFKRCKLEECPRGRWFELGSGIKAGAHRKDADFCSKDCANKNLRNRKALALQLHNEGASIVQIGLKTKTDRDKIERWITAAKRTKGAR